MNSFLFDECVNEIDKNFEKENCKVILIVDNCPAYPIIEGLKAVELVFLPPNTTLKTQPMDHRLLLRLIRAVKTKKIFPETSILDAMLLLISVWSEVSETTI